MKPASMSHFRVPRIALALALVLALVGVQPLSMSAATTLLSASFNSGNDGFTYADDLFGTSQPAYASGARTTSGGYGSTGGLQVSLGGVDATAITNGMSGGWQYTLNLANAETGVSLSFRYKLDQTATYEYDEYTRMLVKVDGVAYGRGAKNYVDHIGGDGSSSQGNSSTYLPTTDWQQHQIYLGNLAAGAHTVILGGLNNKKDAADESTTIVIDDVTVTSGNAAPVASDAKQIVERSSLTQFLAYDHDLAQYDDRCSGSGVSCSTQGNTTNFMNALAYVEGKLQGMGYTTFRHAFNYNGNTGTDICGTKLGVVTPTQMYIVAGHLDARSGGDGFDDDASGVALGLEVARSLSGSDVTTDKSVRFCFWDKEELGLYGAYGYVQDRRSLQGTLDEPTWLGVIQHDMVLYDHGAGTRTTAQSVYADLDVEWRAGTTKEADSRALALKWSYVNGTYAPDYPATAYNYSTNTDDTAFHPYVASISVRENRRSLTSGTNAEWINPYYHTTSDIESSYTRDDDADGKRDDIELGYNAVRTTLGLVAELAGAHILAPNTPPVADPQTVSTNEDAAVGVTLTGSDADGNPLTFRVTVNPAHGALSGAAPNLTYTPALNYNGADSFQFVANDGRADSGAATVGITVAPVNDPPTANNQTLTTPQDTAAPVTLTGSDLEGDPLTFSVVTGPANGTLSGSAPNLTYTPNPGYFGADAFTYVANDGQADSGAAGVTITVTRLNHAPTADAQAVTTGEDVAVGVTLSGSDPDGDALTYQVTISPGHGALSGSAPNLTYTPATNFNGPDSFAFVVNDGFVSSAEAAVSITVNPVNDAPTANNQAVSVTQNTAVAITLTGADVEGGALTYAVMSNPAHGALSGAAPNLTYTPTSGYTGADSFTFVSNDGAVNSNIATVSITVNPSGPILYLSSAGSGTAGGVSFADEDVLIKNQGTGVWTMYFDGSDVGVSGTDVDAFEMLADGALLFSFDTDFSLSGFGTVDDSDILKFTPTSTGATTTGGWQWYFDGSDVGLSTTGEDVDALAVLPDGRILVSTLDTYSVTGASGDDEDLIAFTPSALGSTTSGTWAIYFDGSDVGLSTNANEDVNAVDVDAAGKVYLSTLGSFSVTGVSGDSSDIFVCTPSALGSTTACSWAMYWDGSTNGFSGQDTDALSVMP